MTTVADTSGWDGILEPGEHILWQGQPDPRLDFSGRTAGSVATAVFMVAFAVFWTYQAVLAGDGGFQSLIMPVFGLVFVCLGLWRAGGQVFWESYRRRHTWYTLTDQRAFIATDLFRQRDLDAYLINGQTILTYNGAAPGDIWFATDFVRTRRGSRRRKIGFERVQDAHQVHRMMLDVQKAQA